MSDLRYFDKCCSGEAPCDGVLAYRNAHAKRRGGVQLVHSSPRVRMPRKHRLRLRHPERCVGRNFETATKYGAAR